MNRSPWDALNRAACLVACLVIGLVCVVLFEFESGAPFIAAAFVIAAMGER